MRYISFSFFLTGIFLSLSLLPVYMSFFLSYQYYLDGSGTEVLPMIPAAAGFCVLSQVSGVNNDQESCRVEVSGSQWLLTKDSAVNGIRCGAVCMQTTGATPPVATLGPYTLTGLVG
jgi:hypothetical protein